MPSSPPLTKGRKTTALLSWFPSCGQPLILSTPVLSLSKGITEHLQSSTLVIEDPGFFACIPRAIPWRHLRAPAGVAAPQSRTLFRGEDCLSVASSAALTFRDRGKGPRRATPGPPLVLGPFAETKGPRRAGPSPAKFPRVARGRNPASISPPKSCGAATPQELLPPFCHPGLDPGSRAFVFCSCSRAISWRFLLGRMRCGRYKYREARWTAKACPGP